MKRKHSVTKTPRRKAAFSKTEYKRAIKTTGDIGLPVRQIDFHPDGGFSLVIAKPPTSDSAANKNPWDEVPDTAAELMGGV